MALTKIGDLNHEEFKEQMKIKSFLESRSINSEIFFVIDRVFEPWHSGLRGFALHNSNDLEGTFFSIETPSIRRLEQYYIDQRRIKSKCQSECHSGKLSDIPLCRLPEDLKYYLSDRQGLKLTLGKGPDAEESVSGFFWCFCYLNGREAVQIIGAQGQTYMRNLIEIKKVEWVRFPAF